MGGTTSSTAGAGGTAGGGEGGAAGGAMGGGGAGGGMLHAADWTMELNAVYLFEDSANLGLDASGNANALTVGAGVGTDIATFKQGALAAFFMTSGPFLSRVADDPFTASTSFTLGGWFHVPQVGTAQAMVRRAGDTGFHLRFSGAGNYAICRTDSPDPAFTDATTQNDTWPTSQWVHVTCVWDDGDITAYAGDTGMGTNAANPVVHETSTPFSLGFMGAYADEVFFYGNAMNRPSIQRIRACGIDGKLCDCNPSEPSEYLDCNGVQCDQLAACDRATP